MAIDKSTLTQLQRFATAFKEARERGANESDSVMYIVKFFEELGGYDSLAGEISKEHAIKDRYCDIAIKLDGTVRFLVECKAASVQDLVDKHIEQAENYASRAGIRWVLLTNGIKWKLFHLAFAESEGITHDLAFEADLLEDLEKDADAFWSKVSLLTRGAIERDELEQFWSHKKALSASSVVRALFHEDVLLAVRRELNRKAPARLDIEDVSNAIREILSKEAILEAGEITITKRRKRRRKVAEGVAPTAQIQSEAPNVALAPDALSAQAASGQAPSPTPVPSTPVVAPSVAPLQDS